jgi:hypothetical protein
MPGGSSQVNFTAMARRTFRYDPLLADRVLSYIQSGGYPLVAAEAAGLPSEVFLAWVKWGAQKKAREPYRGFARGVRQAVAHGRLIAELAVHDKDPKFWLTHGPGRETAQNPGWTGEVKASATQDSAGQAGPTDAQWQTLYVVLMRALSEFPEARLAVANALRESTSFSAAENADNENPA